MKMPSMKNIVITIEGPAACGKTTIGTALANYFAMRGGVTVKRVYERPPHSLQNLLADIDRMGGADVVIIEQDPEPK